VKVLLDTNALMMPSQFQIDLFEELRMLLGSFEPVVLSGVLDELAGLSRMAQQPVWASRLAGHAPL
jgi:rRNA-processing protein FCF1